MSVPYWVLLCPPSHQNRSTSFDLTGEYASHGQTTEDPPIDWTLKLIRFIFFSQASTRLSMYFRRLVHGYGCVSLVLYHRRTCGPFFNKNFFPFLWESDALWARISSKINSSLQIAQSSVPNPLQALLVMIYSTRTKDISRTPEYIFWQRFDFTLWVIFRP